MKAIFLFAILMSSLPFAHAETFGCVGAIGNTQDAVVSICKIKFSALDRDPEKYDGRYLIVRGLVVIDGPHARLFESRDAHIYGGGEGGIVLWIDDEDISYVRELADQQKPTTIRGQFFSNRTKNLNGVSGRIEVSKGGVWITTLPGEPPEPPRARPGA